MRKYHRAFDGPTPVPIKIQVFEQRTKRNEREERPTTYLLPTRSAHIRTYLPYNLGSAGQKKLNARDRESGWGSRAHGTLNFQWLGYFNTIWKIQILGPRTRRGKKRAKEKERTRKREENFLVLGLCVAGYVHARDTLHETFLPGSFGGNSTYYSYQFTAWTAAASSSHAPNKPGQCTPRTIAQL